MSFMFSRLSAAKPAATRFVSTSAQSIQKRPSLVLASSVAIAGTALYYYSTMSSVQAAEPVLKGEFVDLTLKEKFDLSENTKLLRFSFADPEAVSGLINASAVVIKYKDATSGKNVIRPYTPISDVNTKGHLDLLVKAYPGGKASVHVTSLQPGETLAFKGPIVKYPWDANKHTEIALIGGGTGITPLYQLMHAIASDPADKTKVTLLFGNATEADILMKDTLDALAAKHPDQIKVVYTLDKAPAGWKGLTGFLSKDVLAKYLPKASADNVKVFVCGPPGMYKAISGTKVSPSDQGELTGALAELGFTKEQVFKF
ncbi:uncharacterized protein V1510DRAFT_414124 [Dipodascopsis tothii]|uniref:uncharacterized protein n=1 Tax=Dipodascopsis tothii TaxID=44089 RepID=UPI0034CDD866